MAQLDLNLTLAGENYYDGSAQNISYAEERDEDIIEIFTPEGSGCKRIFYTAWADRFKFIHNMVGFAKVKENYGGGSFPDAFGWNGKYVHRVLPQGYHMGQKDSSDASFVNWVYATRATAYPYGTKSKNETTNYTPVAEYARIVVDYAALDYELKTDAEIAYAGSVTGASGFQEWLRYCRIVQKPAAQYFQYPQHALKLVDNPSAGQSKPITFYPSVIDAVGDFLVYIKDLPYDPITGILTCFGKVNKYNIFATPDNISGQPAETLHFIAADITRLPRRMGQKYWDVMLGFKKCNNKDENGAQVNHNYVRDLITVGGVQKLRFFRVSNDGTSNTSGDNPMIGLEDFQKIFWIP